MDRTRWSPGYSAAKEEAPLNSGQLARHSSEVYVRTSSPGRGGGATWGLSERTAWAGTGMSFLPSGGYLRAVLARARDARLLVPHRRVSGGPGCARDPPAGAGLLRGQLDRFGGVSVRLGALDCVDAAAFQKALQGKCLGQGSLAPPVSNEVTATPTPAPCPGGARDRTGFPLVPGPLLGDLRGGCWKW